MKPDLSTPNDIPIVLEEKVESKHEHLQAAKENLNEQSSGSSTDNSSDEDDDSDDDDDDDDDDSNTNEEEEEIDGIVRKKNVNVEIHNRPRDESPNSKRVRK